MLFSFSMITSATKKTMDIVYLILILGCSYVQICFYRLLLNRFCQSCKCPVAFLKRLPVICIPRCRRCFILEMKWTSSCHLHILHIWAWLWVTTSVSILSVKTLQGICFKYSWKWGIWQLYCCICKTAPLPVFVRRAPLYYFLQNR